MKCYFLNYADGKEHVAKQRKVVARAKFLNCFDGIFACGPQDISEHFYRKNRKILQQSIGAGFWLWKPYIILQALKKVPNNSVIFYCDVDHILTGDLDHYCNLAQAEDIVLFHEEPARTAAECTASGSFLYMNCANTKYFSRKMVLGGYNFWRSNVKAISFVREWLYWCCQEKVLAPTFVDINNIGDTLSVARDPDQTQYGSNDFLHCFDQSVLTILAEKFSIKSHKTPVFAHKLKLTE